MGFLDLIGVAMIGVVGALAVTGIKSGQPGTRVAGILDFLNLETQTFQMQVAILASAAAATLILKTLLSMLFTRKTIFFLSRRGAYISSDMVERLLSQPLLKIQNRSSQELLYAVTSGVQNITLGILATGISVISDTALLLVMSIGLVVVDPTTAMFSILIFAILGYFLYKSMSGRAYKLGFENSRLSVKSNEEILEVLSSYREALVRNRREYYARSISKTRIEISNTLAEIQFMPNISKYMIEISIVFGAVIISMAQFILQDSIHAIATLTVFLAAGTRIAPAVMRLQQGAIQIRSGIGSATPTLDLVAALADSKTLDSIDDNLDLAHTGFEPELKLLNVSFTYPSGDVPALSGISMNVATGALIALVGSSGAGKTTLVDILLGIFPPNEGTVLISGLSPLDAIAKWPGALAYVPQDVLIVNGSIRENLSIGFPLEIATDELCWRALEIAQLKEHMQMLPKGLDQEVGERGAKISGGQRQRLGIARAMFTQPKLLVLDEATSSLDGQTESDISDAIKFLKGEVTVVMIAHRLSTVRNADLVIYMDKGKILAQGTFEEVRSKVPDFDRQAQLMGL